jgi:hypothetical protein
MPERRIGHCALQRRIVEPVEFKVKNSMCSEAAVMRSCMSP